VRKFARELGVPLAEVKGSGPKGRITQEDVQAFTKSVMAGAVQTAAKAQAAKAARLAAGGVGGLDLLPWPKVDFAKFGPIERKELSRIKKISGANLHRNWVMIPARHQQRRWPTSPSWKPSASPPTRRTPRRAASRSPCSPL
jgi:pyruvate dehydrogenase E2 component (dihydrolipoamide acetyltransferase)